MFVLTFWTPKLYNYVFHLWIAVRKFSIHLCPLCKIAQPISVGSNLISDSLYEVISPKSRKSHLIIFSLFSSCWIKCIFISCVWFGTGWRWDKMDKYDRNPASWSCLQSCNALASGRKPSAYIGLAFHSDCWYSESKCGSVSSFSVQGYGVEQS